MIEPDSMPMKNYGHCRLNGGYTFSPHPEEIVAGSHSSLGANGRAALTDILHKYSHVYPALGDPVTGCTQVVCHEIGTNCAQPIRLCW